MLHEIESAAYTYSDEDGTHIKSKDSHGHTFIATIRFSEDFRAFISALQEAYFMATKSDVLRICVIEGYNLLVQQMSQPDYHLRSWIKSKRYILEESRKKSSREILKLSIELSLKNEDIDMLLEWKELITGMCIEENDKKGFITDETKELVNHFNSKIMLSRKHKISVINVNQLVTPEDGILIDDTGTKWVKVQE